MTQEDLIRNAFRSSEASHARAPRPKTHSRWGRDVPRARLFSAGNILASLANIPMVAGAAAAVAVVVTSPQPPAEALRHAAVRAGCEVAALAGVPAADLPGFDLVAPRVTGGGEGACAWARSVSMAALEPALPPEPEIEVKTLASIPARFVRP